MGLETVPIKMIDQFIDKENCVIIDLRGEKDYQSGHIKNAINIPYCDLCNHKEIFDNHKDVVLYCGRGNISLMAAREYANCGCNVINMYGGIHAYRGQIINERNNN